MLDYGFRYYSTKKILSKYETVSSVDVWAGSEDILNLGPSEDIYLTLTKPEFNSLELIASKNLGVKAPINKDDVLDSLDFVIDGKTLKSIDLVAVKKIDSKGFLSSTFEAIGFYIYSFFHARRSQLMTICYLNDDFVELSKASISPLDRGFLFGDSVYEVLAAYKKNLFRLDDHVDRLNKNLELLGIKVNLSNTEIKTILKEVCLKNLEEKSNNLSTDFKRSRGNKESHSKRGYQANFICMLI